MSETLRRTGCMWIAGSEPRQPPKRATRRSRMGRALLSARIPWQLKKQLDAASDAAGRSITDEVTARLTASFRIEGDAP
jgi:hypothetical protein